MFKHEDIHESVFFCVSLHFANKHILEVLQLLTEFNEQQSDTLQVSSEDAMSISIVDSIIRDIIDGGLRSSTKAGTGGLID